ncbi:hypothetical protein OIU78_018549, partial [Salix suchowensis]
MLRKISVMLVAIIGWRLRLLMIAI